MSTNQEIIKKADIALSDLTTAGLLNPMQGNKFFRTLIDQPTLLKQVRSVFMTAPRMNINKIGFGSRILLPATAVTAASSRSAPTLSQVVLNTKDVIAEIRIPYEVLEDNVEGGKVNGALQEGAGGLHQTMVELIAERAALDLEELALLGDTDIGGSDPYLDLLDGYIKLSSVNTTAWNAAFSKDCVKAAIKTMPTRFQRDRANMVMFCSVNNETELRDQYGNRSTGLGDQMVQGRLPLYVHGSKVEGVALMPASKALLTNPQNLIFGIQRNVQIEYDKDIRTREFIVVLTARVATQIEEAAAVVRTTSIS